MKLTWWNDNFARTHFGGSKRTTRRLRRYRTGAEGRIGHLKRRYGVARSRLKALSSCVPGRASRGMHPRARDALVGPAWKPPSRATPRGEIPSRVSSVTVSGGNVFSLGLPSSAELQGVSKLFVGLVRDGEARVARLDRRWLRGGGEH